METYIEELLGTWINNYPYLKGTAEIILVIVALVFLQNLLYGLGKLLSGER